MTLIPSQFEISVQKLRRGLTIVELLVAISILSLLAVILVPQVRMLNRERGIREAARVVGSIFVEASNRARTEGYAAVGIRRNPNYLRKVNSTTGTPSEIFYASTTLYLLRSLPPYTGNQENDTAYVESTAADFTYIVIPRPLDTNVYSQIREGCRIRLGTIQTSLEIMEITDVPGGQFLRLKCATKPHLPAYPISKPLAFRLDRLPQEVANSAVNLPRGFYINLNYSGPTTATTLGVSEWRPRITDSSAVTWTYFSEDCGNKDTNKADIYVVFGPSGGIERLYSNGLFGGNAQPSSSLNLCICSDEIGNSFDAAPDSLPRSVVENGRDLLNQEDVLWTSINNVAGTVSVSPITPVSSTVSNPDATQPVRILQSQAFRAVGQAAGQ